MVKTWGRWVVDPRETVVNAMMRDLSKPYPIHGTMKNEIEIPLFWVLVGDNLPFVFTGIMDFFVNCINHF